MNITQLKQSLPFIIESGLVPNIIGKHGIGKSSVVAQYAKENGYTFHPFFLGQMSDNGDLLGLPEFNRDSSGKALSVSFVHPEKLPKNPKSILFFDELNRASKELLQAIFQLALEGTLHDYTLPKDSAIIMAMNPATDDYSVLDFADKAFADRFVHINLDPTHEEFHEYMTGRYTNSPVSDFLRQQTKLLEETDLKAVTLDFVKPSRRSWDRLQKLELTSMPENLFREAGMGIVGTTSMIAYSSWKENQVKIVDAKDILDNYEKSRTSFIKNFKNPVTLEDIEAPRADIIATVCSNVSEELVIRLKATTLTDNNAKNLVAFLLDCPVENLYAFLLPLREVAQFSTDVNMKAYVLENKQLVEKTREARLAKDAYKTAKEEREAKAKAKAFENSDIPF
jgi:hypothetical protein